MSEVEVIGWDIDPPADGPHEQRLRDQRFVDRGMTTKPVADRETPSDDTQRIRALSAQVEELREGLFQLAIVTGSLIVATDGQEPIRQEREAALASIKDARALLESSNG